jgi:hypothetical protein
MSLIPKVVQHLSRMESDLFGLQTKIGTSCRRSYFNIHAPLVCDYYKYSQASHSARLLWFRFQAIYLLTWTPESKYLFSFWSRCVSILLQQYVLLVHSLLLLPLFMGLTLVNVNHCHFLEPNLSHTVALHDKTRFRSCSSWQRYYNSSICQRRSRGMFHYRLLMAELTLIGIPAWTCKSSCSRHRYHRPRHSNHQHA